MNAIFIFSRHKLTGNTLMTLNKHNSGLQMRGIRINGSTFDLVIQIYNMISFLNKFSLFEQERV